MQLAPEDATRFREDGYLFAGPLLSEEELAAVRAAYERAFEDTGRQRKYRDLGVKEGEQSPRLSVLQILDLCDHDPVFWNILTRPDLLDAIEALIGAPSIRLYSDQGLFKPALHGDTVPWHQDNSYWKLDPPAAVSCWIALDDVDEENGCMWVIPGGHRSGAATHRKASDSVALLSLEVDESKAVSLPMPAGCAMFHHCETPHMTLPNLSPRPRRAWAIHYAPADTADHGPHPPPIRLLRGS